MADRKDTWPPSRKEDFERQSFDMPDVEPVLTCNYIVKGWIGSGTLAMLYGPSGSGKTHVALDMAAHIASGVRWRGKRVTSGRVAYIAAEGGNGIRNRAKALMMNNAKLADANMTVITTHVALHLEAERNALIEVLSPQAPIMVVLDTLARCTVGLDENATEDMAKIVASADILRAALDCTVLIVHHTGKDARAGARGSSALRAAVDTEIEVTESHEIRATKQRDMAEAPPIHFAIKSVFLGKDSDGDDVTAGVPVPASKPKPKPKPIDNLARIALNALQDALAMHGRVMHGEDYPDGIKCVSRSEWQAHCKRHALPYTDAKGALGNAVKRQIEKLMKSGHVLGHSDHYWLVNSKKGDSGESTKSS